MSFFKRLICNHFWVNNPWSMPGQKFTRVGFRDWRIDASWWGCSKCGKVKKFAFNFIPLNWEVGSD